MIAVTTIGYGDIKVLSQAGYILSVFNMLFGSFVVSSFVFVTLNTIKMDHK